MICHNVLRNVKKNEEFETQLINKHSKMHKGKKKLFKFEEINMYNIMTTKAKNEMKKRMSNE